MATSSKKGEKKVPVLKKRILQSLPKKEQPRGAQKSERLYNADLVYQVVRAKMLNKKRPLASTKDRAEVAGSGKKPWPQKGTGRARHGSVRSPIWRGGGVTFGPRKERNYKKGVTKKMANAALSMVFQKKLQEKEIKQVDSITLEEYKTKYFSRWLKDLTKADSASTIVVSGKDTALLKRAGRNIPGVTVRGPEDIDVLDLLSHRYCIITSDASKRLMARARKN